MIELLKLLLSLSFSGTVLILILLLSRPLYRNRLSRQWQYYIWLIVVARMLLPFTPVSYTHLDVYKRQVRSCSSRITESRIISHLFVFSSTWVGSFALFIFDVIAAQITVGLCLFPISFCIISTGLTPPCSEPTTGLKSA